MFKKTEQNPDDQSPPDGFTGVAGWPNAMPVIEGIIPVEEVPQDEDFFDDDEDLEDEG